MNYYKRHLGDYARDTGHLSALEHGIYTLLDYYYSTERPIPKDKAHRIAKANPEETQMVCGEFFVSDGAFWRHRRVDKEIAEYHLRSAECSEFWNSIPREVRTAIEGARRASKLKATPTWLTEDHFAEIKSVYELARLLSETTGEPHEVDHVVPLQGKTVCGLHVPWNLQAIPASSNRAKGNRL